MSEQIDEAERVPGHGPALGDPRIRLKELQKEAPDGRH